MAETFAIPAGFPKARVPSLNQRARVAIEAAKAGGGIVASVNISPEGGVTVLTVAGATSAGIDPRDNEWDEALSRG